MAVAAASSSNAGSGGVAFHPMPNDLHLPQRSKRYSVSEDPLHPWADIAKNEENEAEKERRVGQPKQSQVEWDDEADFIMDEEDDLPYPG